MFKHSITDMKIFKGLLLLGLLLLLCSGCSSIRVLVGPNLLTNQATILTLNNGSVSEACTLDLPHYPESITGPSQAFLDGQLVICGATGSFLRVEFCYKLDFEKKEWIFFPYKLTPTLFSTDIWIDNGTKWWQTGGTDDAFYGTMSSETVYYDTVQGSWLSGPDIPRPLRGHCLVELLDGTRLMFAGRTSFILEMSFNRYVFRQYQDGSWKKIEGKTNFKINEFSQTCARLPNGDVMMAGGYGPDSEVGDQVEVWSAEDGLWRVRDDFKLPVPKKFSSSIADEEGNIYLIGGGDDPDFATSDILVWGNDRWQTLENVLPIPAGALPKLTPITDDRFTCGQ